jgi:hypothetical protein
MNIEELDSLKHLLVFDGSSKGIQFQANKYTYR